MNEQRTTTTIFGDYDIERRQRQKERRASNRSAFLDTAKRVLRDHGDFLLSDYSDSHETDFTRPVPVAYRGSVVSMELEQETLSSKQGERQITDRKTSLYITPPHTRDRIAIFTIAEHFDSPAMFSAPTDKGIKVLNGEGKLASNHEVEEAAGLVKAVSDRFLKLVPPSYT